MTGNLPSTYMRPKEVAELFGVSVRTVWRWCGESRKNERGTPFPKAIRLTKRVTCFPREEVFNFAEN